jgi:hypothetical protein
MKSIDRSNPQVIFDAHSMSKPEFVEIYEIIHIQNGSKSSVKELSALWHDIRRRDAKPTDIQRKTTMVSLQQSWSKPGSAASAIRLPDEPSMSDKEEAAKKKFQASKKKVNKEVKVESTVADSGVSRKDQITALMAQGVTSPKDIATQIGAHPSYVSALIKKLKSE